MNNKGINFEESMKNLEKIVTELESGNLNLEESIKKFEEGMRLSKECNEYLQQAEKRITILTENEEGKLEEKDYERNF